MIKIFLVKSCCENLFTHSFCILYKILSLKHYKQTRQNILSAFQKIFNITLLLLLFYYVVHCRSTCKFFILWITSKNICIRVLLSLLLILLLSHCFKNAIKILLLQSVIILVLTSFDKEKLALWSFIRLFVAENLKLDQF